MEGYNKIKYLGSGSFGKVWLYQKKNSMENVVVKSILIDLDDEEVLQQKQNEVFVLARLRHPNIVRYLDSYIHNEALNIVMEYAIHGTLDAYLKKATESLSEDEVLEKFVQILMGINHMHENNVLHRDLKSENVMLTGTKGRLVKIADFGIAKILNKEDETTATIIGTPSYISPELCMGQTYGLKSDIWSLGCILYELCARRRLFDGPIAQVLFAVANATIKEIDTKLYSEEIQALINRMCNIDPITRPDTKYLLNHQMISTAVFRAMFNLGSINF